MVSGISLNLADFHSKMMPNSSFKWTEIFDGKPWHLNGSEGSVCYLCIHKHLFEQFTPFGHSYKPQHHPVSWSHVSQYLCTCHYVLIPLYGESTLTWKCATLCKKKRFGLFIIRPTFFLWLKPRGVQSHSGGDAYVRLKRPPFSASLSPIDPIFFAVAWALTQRPIFFHLICHSMPHDLKSWHLKKILCISP